MRKTRPIFRKTKQGFSLVEIAIAVLVISLIATFSLKGKELIRTDTAKIRASQINHVNGEAIKKDLSVRKFEIDGNIVQRDLYSAFITGHTVYSSEDSLKPDMVDFESCANDFETFLILQDRELKSIANTANLSWYIS